MASSEVQCQPHAKPAIIAPSLLACDLANLASEAQTVLSNGTNCANSAANPRFPLEIRQKAVAHTR